MDDGESELGWFSPRILLEPLGEVAASRGRTTQWNRLGWGSSGLST